VKKNTLKRALLLTPVAVLIVTLFFLNYAVQYFKDTAYTFVYNTNVESVLRFSRELKELSANGYTSYAFGDLYTNMIQTYNKTLGEKNAIVTFLMDDGGQIHHSSDGNRNFLSALLQNADNKRRVEIAFASRGDGEIKLAHNSGAWETIYFHRFYSGPKNYCLYMTVERQTIEAELNANGVVVPISVIGLLLLLTMEYTIWLKIVCIPCGGKGKRDGV
jgi:hypothetical protein